MIQQTGTPAVGLSGAVQVGSPAPDFGLRGLDGETFTLSQHRGEAVILNFWTTWCPPCRYEMPALQEAYARYRGRGMVVLGVNLTELDERPLIEPYIAELNLTFPILLDTESLVSEELYSVIGLPTSVFIDRDGTVREVYIGALPLEQLENKIETLMGAKQ